MSWFGGGGKKDAPKGPGELSFSSGDDDLGHADIPMAPSTVGGGGGAGGAMAELQQFGAQLQQQVMIQTAITEMSDRAFIKCVAGTTMKDPQLGGKEVACIRAATNKWLDTNELLMGRLARKQQQQQQAQAQQTMH